MVAVNAPHVVPPSGDSLIIATVFLNHTCRRPSVRMLH